MLIQTEAELATLCQALHAEPVVFLDTEFVGEGFYYARLGSIQVGTPNLAVIIDPLKVQDLSALGAVLANPAITKVFHAAGQDLQILCRLFGHPVAPLFDTQVAAQLLSGDEQISFDNLVTRIVGQKPAEGHGFTDWLRRPLTKGQIEYALDDVRFLVPVYEAQSRALEAQGRTAWAREEFAKLEDPARFAPHDPEEQYLRIRGSDRLDGAALASLRELAAWREETAQELDLPTGRLARDEVLVELAVRPRKGLRELREVRGLNPQQIDRYGEDLLAAAEFGRTQPPPPRRRRVTIDPALEPTVDFLALCLRSLAEVLSVAPATVATRSDLVALVLAGAEADIALMRGWRREAIGNALLATLEGQATARILPGSHRVHLDWHPADPA